MSARRVVAAVVVAAAGLVGTTVGDVGPLSQPALAATAGFVGVVPARLWETRRANDLLTVDGESQGTGRLGPAATYSLRVTGRGGVPQAGVAAVAVNVTAVDPSAASFLTVHQAGSERPLASNLNLAPARTLPNMAIVPVSADGRIEVYNHAGDTDVVVDVLGWFSTGTDFVGVSPTRVLETRSAPGLVTIDGQQQGGGPLGAGATVDVRITGRTGLPSTGIGSAVLNVTAVDPTAASFLTVYPADEAAPTASNLNLAPGRTLPNLVMVRVSAAGDVTIRNEFGRTDVVVDVLGWFPTGSMAFVPVAPARVLETRPGVTNGTTDGVSNGTGRVAPDTTLPLQISGRAGVPPTGAGAVALNVTAVDPSAPSFVTVSPAGAPRPTASNLNLAPGRTLPSMVIVPLPADGRVELYHFAGTTDLVVDVLGWFPGAPAAGPDVAVAGALSAPHPTMEHVSVVWSITGDADGDSQVLVRSRPLGSATWRAGMPLRRVPAGSGDGGFAWNARHAGTVFGLAPGTTYEIEARLVDPDGGGETRVITATTRSVPTIAGTVRPVTPTTIGSVLGSAQPGDVIELGAGTYAGFQVNRSGTPQAPIVLRNGGGAVVEGEIGIFLQHDIHIHGLTVNGRIRFNGSDRVSITRNTVNATVALQGHGIITFLRAEDAYIADNVVNGVTAWNDAALGASGDNLGEGIAVTGPGHVIEHNRVTGTRDAISFIEDTGAVDQFSLDVLDNDIVNAADDGVEADFCLHNCRIMRNRLTNTFVALSAQPTLGGPAYFVRNVAYNVAHVAFKLYRGSSGDVIVNNTVVKAGDAFGNYSGRPVSNLYMRNNLFVGGPGGTYGGFGNGTGRVFDVRTLDVATADADHDGYGSTTGTFTWRFGALPTGEGLAALRSATTERNAVQVGMSSFLAPVAFPGDPLTVYTAPDLRLAAGGAAVDAGVGIAGLTDGSAGTAPDLGAHEVGAPVPGYGPRP